MAAAVKAEINAAGISLIMPTNLKNAKGSIVRTPPSGKTEYQMSLNGTNSFNQLGGISLKPTAPLRKLSATRNV